MFLSRKGFAKNLALPRYGGALLFAAAAFAIGLTTGAMIVPGTASRAPETVAPAPARSDLVPSQLRTGYPAELLRVIDGDTFEARVRIWPGTDVTTKVRMRSIDAPEMKARCDDERVMALASRDALARFLNEGSIAISNVGQDKYGGRVDADVSTRQTVDVGAAMLNAGMARRYAGGRRESWCDAQR